MVSLCVQAKLQDNAVTSLLRGWTAAVLSSSTDFGRFSHEFCSGRMAVMKSRCRDVLPLPVARSSHVVGWSPHIDFNVALGLLNMACAGLNFLFLGGDRGAVPQTATTLHLWVFRRICSKLDNAFVEFLKVERAPAVDGSFHRMTSIEDGDKFPNLRADDVDLLVPAAQLDPMGFLPDETRQTLTTPSKLFPAGVEHIASHRLCKEPHHGDRVTLTIRLLRARKLSLMRHAEAAADTFVVKKSDGSRLREIWNGGRLTKAALPSPKPPLQATPASLSTLEASDDRPLWASCRDGKVFFDQLRVPLALRPYFGRPAVSIAELLRPPPCESGAAQAEGMTRSEISDLVLDGPPVDEDTYLIPVNNAWPMGFGWSSYVAQSVMVSSCLNAGFKEEVFLSDERLLLPTSHRCIAIATDDVNLFQRLSEQERADLDELPLACLDAEWSRMGLQGHPSKSIDLAKDIKTLGVELCGGVRLQSRGARLWSLIETSLDLLNVGVASPAAVAVLNGHLQWQNLMNRPLYSCLHDVYEFIHRLPDSVPEKVPAKVVSEILLNVGLFPFWSSDLRRPWWPCMPATDASPAFGFGLSIAKCDPSISRAVAAGAADSSCVVRLVEEADVHEVPRTGPVLRLPLEFDDFKTVFSIKANEVSHSGAMELEAVKLALLRLTRSSRMHGHRGAILVDAQAVGFALRKGRTSAGTLRRGVCAAAAVSLAADLKLSFPYLPSESNPADYPSRGKVRKRTGKKKHTHPQRCSVELMARAYRRANRRWRDCNSSVFY